MLETAAGASLVIKDSVLHGAWQMRLRGAVALQECVLVNTRLHLLHAAGPGAPAPHHHHHHHHLGDGTLGGAGGGAGGEEAVGEEGEEEEESATWLVEDCEISGGSLVVSPPRHADVSIVGCTLEDVRLQLATPTSARSHLALHSSTVSHSRGAVLIDGTGRLEVYDSVVSNHSGTVVTCARGGGGESADGAHGGGGQLRLRKSAWVHNRPAEEGSGDGAGSFLLDMRGCAGSVAGHGALRNASAAAAAGSAGDAAAGHAVHHAEGSVRVEASMFLNNSIGILSSGDTPALVNGTVLRNNIAPRGAARGPSTPPPSGLEQMCVGVLVFSRYACIRRAALF